MDAELTLAYVASNLIALFTVIMAMRWPTPTRVLLGMIFLAAGVANLLIVSSQPHLYLKYADTATHPFYRDFILGPFTRNIQLYVTLIAISELLIGIFIMYKGLAMRVAMTGALIFLLALAPLGIGSAFPATLLLSLAFYFLLRKKVQYSVFEILYQRITYSNP